MSTATQPERLRDLKSGVRDLIMLDPRIIRVEKGHNPRNYALPENRAHLDELKASIRANGTLQPLAVRWEAATKEAVLVDGECRLIANLELIKEGVEIVAVPTFQVKAGNEAERLVIALTANTGKPLSKWEIGTAFQKLVNMGWEPSRIATAMGYSERYVTESMELSDAPQDIKDLLSQQAVTPSLALGALRKSGSGASLVIKTAVEKAKASARPGKKAPVAKREKKKESAIKMSPAVANTVMAALEEAAVNKDKICAKQAEDAIAALAGKIAKGAIVADTSKLARGFAENPASAQNLHLQIVNILYSVNSELTAGAADEYAAALIKAGVKLSIQ